MAIISSCRTPIIIIIAEHTYIIKIHHTKLRTKASMIVKRSSLGRLDCLGWLCMVDGPITVTNQVIINYKFRKSILFKITINYNEKKEYTYNINTVIYQPRFFLFARLFKKSSIFLFRNS